jgi:hypothetical protein
MSEVNLILRTAAVQSAAVRQLQNKNRVNISGIAAITGVPRGEVSRILNPSENNCVEAIQGRQNVASKILSAWHSDPEYLTASRRPRTLKLFGRGQTFESLAKTYGQGIPVRAILDELKRIGAIQLATSSQKISPRMPLAINPRITYKGIKAFDAATNHLFLCLSSQSDASFVETVYGTKAWSGRAPQVRRPFGANIIALLRELQSKLEAKQANHSPRNAQKVAQLSVNIVYSETNAHSANQSLKSRQNLHRTR